MAEQRQAQQYLRKLSQLSETVDFYFSSDLISDYIQKINAKYGIQKSGYLADLIIDSVLTDFNFVGLEEKIKIDFNLNQDKAKQLAIDILGIIFLPIDDYLSVDIKKEIEKRGGDIRQYQKYIDEFLETMENETFNLIDELVKKHEELIDPDGEKVAALDLFMNCLVDILKSRPGDALVGLNSSLIYLLYNVKGFKEEIPKILLESREKLTEEEFILDGRRTEPTVANWIHDFIKSEGSDIFNELALSKYLINSANARILNEEEKKLLRKLLILYRNLKFFPESLADLPPEEWEIIPLEKVKEVLTKARTVSAPIQTEDKKESAAILPPESEKKDPLKAVPTGASLEKEEELPNISRLISQARKEAEEKFAETNSTPPPIKSITLEEVVSQAERVVSELKISLSQEEKNRLKNILVSFLKGIRDQIETKDALLKSKEEGGLNFTQQQVERIFNLIKTQKPQEEKSPIKEKTFDVSSDEQMKDVLRAPSEDVIAKSPKSDKKEEVQPQLQPPPPAVLETFREKLKEKITSQPILSQLPSQPRIAPVELRGEPSRLTPPPLSSPMSPESQVRRIEVPEIKEIKPRLEDIKRSSFSGWKRKVELVGPIEEIRNLTLADLREMSDNPAKALGKIKEKISLLEKESFLKKIQAIKSWRENEIYQLYLKIGRQVIQERTNLAKTLERRRSQGLPILTEEEISAIMDFNKSLRF